MNGAKFLPRSTKILLVSGAVILGGCIVTTERPPNLVRPVKAPFVVTFSDPVNITGLTPGKLAAALVKRPPVAGSRVFFDKRLIFPPPIDRRAAGDSTTSDITIAQQTKAGGGFEIDARHVAQSIGYDKAEDVVAFFEALK
jgi:hypothetical protein